MPNVPKPLHGIAPRTIMGQAWWDIERQKVYASTNYHCACCGVHKSEAQAHQWLEAHEYWDIDYKKGIANISKIIPLCHYCHNFIHSGRLSAIMGIEKSESEVKNILTHGFKILSANKLQCFIGAIELADDLGVNTLGVTNYNIPEHDVKWGDWKLLFNGNEYKSKFKNMTAWKKHYDNINKVNKFDDGLPF